MKRAVILQILIAGSTSLNVKSPVKVSPHLEHYTTTTRQQQKNVGGVFLKEKKQQRFHSKAFEGQH